MRLPHLPFVKICCISSLTEAELATAAGASAIGLVSAMPSGPGVVDEHVIAEIAAATPPPVSSFLLTAFQNASDIIKQHQLCRTSTIQLVDHVEPCELELLREWLPGIKLVQVIHVTGDESVNEAVSVSEYVDAILLDSGNRSLEVKELGGTGRTHDWTLSRRIRQEIPIPLFLAGGLNADNVIDAIQTVEPFGLDLCSGVRTNDKLDEAKLKRFFETIRDL